MLVRKAAAADVPAVLPMVRALLDLHESWDHVRYGMVPNVLDLYAQWLPERAADPRSVFLVAESDGRIVGFIVGTVERSIRIYRVAEFGFIHDMWVDPARRGAGIGRALVAGTLDRFDAMGLAQVRLETARLNEAARRLFRGIGFVESSIEMTWQVPES